MLVSPMIRRVQPIRRMALNSMSVHTRANKSQSQEPMNPTIENAAVQTRGSNKARQNAVSHRRSHRSTGLDSLFDPKSFFANPFAMMQPFGSRSMSPFGNFGSFNTNVAPQISLDMYSDSKAYHLSASVPGVNKEDISIRVDDGMLIIQAERKVERKSDKPEAAGKESQIADSKTSDSSASTKSDSDASVQASDKKGQDIEIKKDKADDMEFHFMESSYGLAERSISLPEDVDVDKLSAKYENGVLKIDLPRSAEPKPSGRTINIE